jgi:hypothetical protein
MKKRLGAVPKGLEWISQETEIAPTVQTTKVSDLSIPAAKRGLQEDLIRATFIIKQEHLEKIKAFAYWERIQIKDVVEEMCEQFFENKKVRSIPQRKEKEQE